MRTFIYFSVLCMIAVVNCSQLSTSQIISQFPNAITTDQRIGGNFAYSTIESRSAPAIVRSPITIQPVTYATAPLAVAHPLYSQSIFGSPFFNPIISSPFYPGIVGQAPVIQAPVAGQDPIFGQPIGQYPGQGPIQGPVAAPPQGIPQGPAPPPPGATVDDDTVSVESA